MKKNFQNCIIKRIIDKLENNKIQFLTEIK